MDVLVAYDVNTETKEGQRRLRKVAKVCTGFGQRVQKSLFECRVNQAQLEELESKLLQIIDPKKDSLRLYLLPGNRERIVRVHGVDHYVDFDEPLIL
jgi:CRISPR-associated endoribonuclease Cas2